MNYRERMKEYLKEPDEYSSQYGKWGILNREQRDLIKRLLREMDGADEVIKHQYFEIEIHDLPSLNKKNIKVPEPINYVDLPTKEIIKKALKIADNRMKAIILFMSSSGCAKRETLNLTIQDFIDATKEYHNSNNINEVIETLKEREDVIPMFRLKRQKTIIPHT